METNLPAALTARYVIERELGRGGNGIVYLAHHVSLDRPVVVKVLLMRDTEGRDRFQREARVLANLDHPGLVRLLDFGQEEGCSYLVCAYEAGEALDLRLARDGARTWVEAARIALDISRTLQVVHAAGVVHRDIKPSNVLMVADGHAKLLDFGLAYLLEGERLTKTSTFMGTPAYAAPEQVRGRDVGPFTDLYGLGILLCEMIGGRNPFWTSSLHETIHNHLNVPIEDLLPPLPHTPPPLVALIVHLLAKSPPMRPQGAQEVVTRLGALLSGEARKAPAGSPAQRETRIQARAGRTKGHRVDVHAHKPSHAAADPGPLGAAGRRAAAAIAVLGAMLVAVAFLTRSRPGTAGRPTPISQASPAVPISGGVPVRSPAGDAVLVAQTEAALEPWSTSATIPRLDPLLLEVQMAPLDRRAQVLAEGLRRHPLVQALTRLRPYESQLHDLAGRLAQRPQLLARLAAATAELSKLELVASWGHIPVPQPAGLLRSLPGTLVATMPLRPLAMRTVFGGEVELYSEDLSLGLPDRISRWTSRIRLDLPAAATRPVLRAVVRHILSSNAYVFARIRSLDETSQSIVQEVNLFPILPGSKDKGTVYVTLLPAFLRVREIEIAMELRFLPVGVQMGRIGVGPAEIIADGAR